MKQTAMQNLREDLVLSQVTAKEALIEIKNQEIRKACQEALRITLKTIIKRIDDELLEMEKQQTIEFSEWCLSELLNGNEPKAETMQGLLEIFKNK